MVLYRRPMQAAFCYTVPLSQANSKDILILSGRLVSLPPGCLCQILIFEEAKLVISRWSSTEGTILQQQCGNNVRSLYPKHGIFVSRNSDFVKIGQDCVHTHNCGFMISRFLRIHQVLIESKRISTQDFRVWKGCMAVICRSESKSELNRIMRIFRYLTTFVRKENTKFTGNEVCKLIT